jgi:hypothetical protein
MKRPRYFKVPNTRVDMNSWRVPACYPWRTFYPLITVYQLNSGSLLPALFSEEVPKKPSSTKCTPAWIVILTVKLNYPV